MFELLRTFHSSTSGNQIIHIHTAPNLLHSPRALGLHTFLLNAVIQQHLESVQSEHPGTVQEIKNSLHADDPITGDTTMKGAQQLKHHAVEIFNRARFTLHKWHSNVTLHMFHSHLSLLH